MKSLESLQKRQTQNLCHRLLVICLLASVGACSTSCRPNTQNGAQTHKDSTAGNHRFFLSACVDFYDDAITSPYTPELIEKMMKTLKQMGVKRIYWIYYGDATYELVWKECGLKSLEDWTRSKQWADLPKWEDNVQKTIASVRQPTKVAAAAAKKHGLEFYGYIKPYETGFAWTWPEGSPQAAKYGVVPRLGGTVPCTMRFVRENPQMRIKRNMSDIPAGLDSIPICRIRLEKMDAKPTRIKKENIEIWTIPDNYKYEKKEVDFALREVVEKSDHSVIDFRDRLRTPKDAPVRVLYLDGLNLKDKYILITTNFRDNNGDFGNCAIEMVEAYGPDGKKLPITIATSRVFGLPHRNFREFGLEFDSGGGKEARCLDLDNSSGIRGFIAFCRGKNEFLPGALCEAYPEVRSFWLGMVRQCLEAGVDGIDFRIENHSSNSDEPFSYGFNQPIVEEYKKRYGVDISKEAHDPNLLAQLRGEFYTDFLRSAANLIHKAGKKMQVHINVDRMGPACPPSRYIAYPWNIKFDWQKWLSEGFVDEVTLRSLVKAPSAKQRLNDPFAQQVISACRQRDIPIHFNRYVPPFEKIADEIELIRSDGRFRSFILYETQNLMQPDSEGNVPLRYGTIEQWQKITSSFVH